MLFKGKKFGAKITRGVTHSEFDHVAMVLKFEDDPEVHMLDATLSGVNITSWSELATFKDEVYKKIVWRQLETERDSEFWERMEKFVTEVNEKKYSLSVTKLVKRQSMMPQLGAFKSPEQKMIEDDRTFFCSELIAKALK